LLFCRLGVRLCPSGSHVERNPILHVEGGLRISSAV
jgi:hypothetical protein